MYFKCEMIEFKECMTSYYFYLYRVKNSDMSLSSHPIVIVSESPHLYKLSHWYTLQEKQEDSD